MSGNLAGGAKARDTNIKKYGEDYYKKIGKLGGEKQNPKKGFGTHKELAKIMGQRRRNG